MIEHLKDLKALLKLCRAQGVTEITLPSVSLKLGEAPAERGKEESFPEDDTEDTFMTNLEAPLTNEELVAFANGGINEN